MNKEIPKPPSRTYYGFEAMTTEGNESYKELMFDTMKLAINARSACHVIAGKRKWKFRTHVSYEKIIADAVYLIKLQVWRVE